MGHNEGSAIKEEDEEAEEQKEGIDN